MDIVVFNRQTIEAVPAADVPHLIVSITLTPEDLAEPRTNEHTRGLLRLAFWDLEIPVGNVTEAQLYSDAQAEEVVRFVATHLKAHQEIERIVFHCDAGLSRSPGMAAAFAKALNDDDTRFFRGGRRPNMRAYRRTLNACFDAGLMKLPSTPTSND